MNRPESRRTVWALAIGMIAAAMLVVGGCAGVGRTPPKVYLQAIEPVGNSGMAPQFDVTLLIQNPNESALNIRGMTFDLALNGQDFASGVSNERIIIDGLSSGTMRVTAATSVIHILGQALSLAQTRTPRLSFDLEGELLTGGYGGLPFEESGELSFEDIAAMRGTRS